MIDLIQTIQNLIDWGKANVPDFDENNHDLSILMTDSAFNIIETVNATNRYIEEEVE